MTERVVGVIAFGSRVAVRPGDTQSPQGTWWVIDRGPSVDGWWLLPADDEARGWAAQAPQALTQGCIEISARRLAPPHEVPDLFGGAA